MLLLLLLPLLLRKFLPFNFAFADILLHLLLVVTLLISMFITSSSPLLLSLLSVLSLLLFLLSFLQLLYLLSLVVSVSVFGFEFLSFFDHASLVTPFSFLSYTTFFHLFVFVFIAWLIKLLMLLVFWLICNLHEIANYFIFRI